MSTNDTPTPRTDAIINKRGEIRDHALQRLAQDIERELAEAKEGTDNYHAVSDDLAKELVQAHRDLAHLTQENERLRGEVGEARANHGVTQDALTAVIDERDKLRARLLAAEEDKGRVDWLLAHNVQTTHQHTSTDGGFSYVQYLKDRSAIDAARLAQREEGK